MLKGVVCVPYKNTSQPFRAADPAHVQEVLFAVENDPCCYRDESSRATCAVEKRLRLVVKSNSPAGERKSNHAALKNMSIFLSRKRGPELQHRVIE
ncbi:unnamed protein product [Boreogadus saida]